MRPNLVFVMSDDHAAHALGAYGSRVNETPNIDRIATEGVRLDNCFCTNALCAPSRASILTGTYSHVNGVRTLRTYLDNTRTTFPMLMRDSGYATALFGKWHLGHGAEHDPRGFDSWAVFPGQGEYWDPELIEADGRRHRVEGYATDVVTDRSIAWLERQRSSGQPFCLLLHHKAPHRPWHPDTKHGHLYPDGSIAVPETFDDDHTGHASPARVARMRITELGRRDLKVDPPEGMSGAELAPWKYQRYMSDYLRCVRSVDDNVGRILDWLDAAGLSDDTVVVYTSDQGFFLGDHGWFDKRFMYEESIRMPLLVRYPREIPAGTARDAMVTNVDFAQTFLDYADLDAPGHMQGRSMRPILRGDEVPDWRTSVYYRYWEHDDEHHHVWAHYGVRTQTHKLVYYYADGLGLPGASTRGFEPEWELFDLVTDPYELHSVHGDPAYSDVRAELESELRRLQDDVGDEPWRPAR